MTEIPLKYVVHQAPVLKGMGELVVAATEVAFRKKILGKTLQGDLSAFPIPGPIHEVEISPRPRALVESYIRHIGGDPEKYRDRIPPHFYPQWSFSLLGTMLGGFMKESGYPLLSGLNAGTSVKVNAPLPANEPMKLKGQLVSVDRDERRVILDLRFITETREHPEALDAHLFVYVPLKSGKKESESGRAKEKPIIPFDAKEIGRWKLSSQAGFEFSKLTGDFNPIHWLAPFAKMAGFKKPILQGFSLFSRSMEALEQYHEKPLKEIRVQFKKPLILSSNGVETGLFIGVSSGVSPGISKANSGTFWVGDSAGSQPNLEGNFSV